MAMGFTGNERPPPMLDQLVQPFASICMQMDTKWIQMDPNGSKWIIQLDPIGSNWIHLVSIWYPFGIHLDDPFGFIWIDLDPFDRFLNGTF